MRLHILFVLVLLVIQSCAKSNLVPDSSIREIGFRPIQSLQTKSETFPEDEAFGLYAFKVEAEAGTSYNSGVWTS